MKRIALLLCIVWLASAPASAQKFISMEDKAFNWGG